MVLEELLLEQGHLVQTAQTGSDAIAALNSASSSYDLLVTDVRLPEVDGWSIARLARELSPSVAVVYMTGDSGADHAANGVAGSRLIQKPFLFEEFVQVVSSVLR
jgi:DNA-binding response OmpR family regulator